MEKMWNAPENDLCFYIFWFCKSFGHLIAFGISMVVLFIKKNLIKSSIPFELYHLNVAKCRASSSSAWSRPTHSVSMVRMVYEMCVHKASVFHFLECEWWHSGEAKCNFLLSAFNLLSSCHCFDVTWAQSRSRRKKKRQNKKKHNNQNEK